MKENTNFSTGKLKIEEKLEKDLAECNQNLEEIEKEIAMYSKKNGEKKRKPGFISRLLFGYRDRNVIVSHSIQKTTEENSIKGEKSEGMEDKKSNTRFKIIKPKNNGGKKKKKRRKKKKKK